VVEDNLCQEILIVQKNIPYFLQIVLEIPKRQTNLRQR
jgi:hypothetical protein